MQTLKMLSLISATMLLTWCSMTKINQSEGLTGDNITWEVITGVTDSGVITTDIISWDVISWDIVNWDTTNTNTGITTTEVSINTGNTIVDTPAIVAEETALKEKIRILIEKRKIDSKPATELTEEDIQLMTDVLQAIVSETGK